MIIKEKLSGYHLNVQNLRFFVWKIVRTILVIGICFIIIYPMMVKITTAFMEVKDLYDSSVRWVPKKITLENFKLAYRFMYYPEALFNSMSLAIIISVLHLTSCTIVGYGLARFDFKASKIIFFMVIVTLVVPPQMIMIAQYLNFRFFNIFGLIPGDGLNLLGTYWPFILTAATGTGLRNGLFIFVTRQFFKGMPKELEEAAYVDGAGPLKTFIRVMIPGAIPAMIIVFLFSFVWQWNDVFYTNLYMRGGGRLLAFTLMEMTGEYGGYIYNRYGHLSNADQLTESDKLSLLNNAGMVLFILPVLLFYGLLQRYFIESIQRTGIVG